MEGYYTGNKPPKVAKEYFKRIIELRKDFGMRPVKRYDTIIKQLDKREKNGNKVN